VPGLTPSAPEPLAARVRRRVLISGRVQGVWFRESCKQEATARGVTGWVRNLSDGRVEAVLEGPEAAVARVVQWCGHGPAHARVDRVEVEVGVPVGEQGFRVR
jgi:acylphosphatase